MCNPINFVILVFYLITVCWGQYSLEYDQVLFQENKVIFFKNQPFQMQIWKGDDFRKKNRLFRKRWTHLESPFSDFYPLYWATGQNNQYLVLEFSQRSIWLLDSNFQRQSWLPLPQTVLNLEWTDAKIFWIDPYFVYFVFLKQKKVLRYLQTSQRLVSLRVFDLAYIYDQVSLFFDEEKKPLFYFSNLSLNHYYSTSMIFKKKQIFIKYATTSLSWKISQKKSSLFVLKFNSSFFCFESNILFICQ